MLEKYRYWLKNNAKKKNGQPYADKSVNSYSNSLRNIKEEFGIDLLSFKSLDNLIELKNKLFSIPRFLEKDIRGDRMYSCAVKMFLSFVCDTEMEKCEEDINKIQNDRLLSYDEKNSYIETICNLRNPQFQRNFRNELLEEFNNKCAICAINDKRLLIASHIIPYSDCDSKAYMYKSHNGLLLCAMHDALFDKHLISFAQDGKIKIKSDISPKLYEFLNINDKLRLDKRYLTSDRKECLKKHMEYENK